MIFWHLFIPNFIRLQDQSVLFVLHLFVRTIKQTRQTFQQLTFPNVSYGNNQDEMRVIPSWIYE